MAVEDILARVHIERRPALLVQRTESDILEATRPTACPVLPPQVLQQRQMALECFHIVAHSASSPPQPSLESLLSCSQARMVGEPTFLQTQGPEDLQSRSHPGQRGCLRIAITTLL